MEDKNLDVWLKNVNENEFDEKMDTYLSSEKLVHFQEDPGKREKILEKSVIYFD